jgi:hypothetical protein
MTSLYEGLIAHFLLIHYDPGPVAAVIFNGRRVSIKLDHTWRPVNLQELIKMFG